MYTEFAQFSLFFVVMFMENLAQNLPFQFLFLIYSNDNIGYFVMINSVVFMIAIFP